MKRLKNSKTSHSGIDAKASSANSRGAECSHESPRARKTIPSEKRMKPVQQIGVFHDQNGSTCATVNNSEPIISSKPLRISFLPPCVMSLDRGTSSGEAPASRHLCRAAELCAYCRGRREEEVS